MSLYNPYENYDKGMDDAYMGIEPSMSSRDYMEGYDYSRELMEGPPDEQEGPPDEQEGPPEENF